MSIGVWSAKQMSKYKTMSLDNLIKSMEKAPDFGYDDQEAEMIRRGIKYKWLPNNKLEIINKKIEK